MVEFGHCSLGSRVQFKARDVDCGEGEGRGAADVGF